MPERAPVGGGEMGLAADPARRAEMGRAGRERALRLFDWDRTAEQFEQIYASVRARGR